MKHKQDYSLIPAQLMEEQEIVKFCKQLINEEVPDSTPVVAPIDELSNFNLKLDDEQYFQQFEKKFSFHSFTCLTGMFGRISKQGSAFLKSEFGDKVWLDPICGRGWIAKALREQGLSVFASDIESQSNPVTSVEALNGEDAVNKYKDKSDILILSWAEYDNESDYHIAKAWGEVKPIVLYGEIGGCCFSKRFLQNFKTIKVLQFPDNINAPSLRLCSMVVGNYIDNQL